MSERFLGRAGWRLVAALSLAQLALSAHAADEFSVTPAQIQALGVQLQRLQDAPPAGDGPVFPARVVLPPRQDQVVSAPLAGVVEQLLVSENEAVKAGQPVLRLASPELGELQLKLMEASSQQKLAAATLQRERQLFAEGIVPQRRVLEAESASQQASARLRQSQAALRLAGVDAAAMRKIADGSPVESTVTLRARSTGLVQALVVKPGQRVEPADALMSVADTSRLWLDVQVPVSWQGSQKAVRGMAVQVVGRAVNAVGQTIGAVATDNQTLTVRAEVRSGANLLRPGEFVQARLPLTSAKGWNVPLPSVVRQGDKAYVFVRTPQGFVATPVTVIDSAGQTVRVTGPLSAGQELATSSVIALKAAWQGKSGGS